jgi:hypothetical protein
VLKMLVRLEEYAFIVSTTTEYTTSQLDILDTKIVLLLEAMKGALSLETEDVMWHFVKFHLTTHTTMWIKKFGHCGQFDAATLERLHKLVSTTHVASCTTHTHVHV